MDEARLQMLQAQIEPHFLFNTLANVRRLYQTDAAAAESMLDNLMRYLAVALPQMRATDSTLGREAALAESYLAIQRIRMGRRLDLRDRRSGGAARCARAADDAADAGRERDQARPESAARGRLRPGQRARRRAVSFDCSVADTGQGFTKTSGGGTGLANTRARLAAIYGPAAELALADQQPARRHRDDLAAVRDRGAGRRPHDEFRRDAATAFAAGAP